MTKLVNRLTNVAVWLENGCDPKWAAAELRMMADEQAALEPTARIDIARWSSSQYLGAPKAGDICTYCGEQWLQDPGGGAGIWHNCHT